MLMGVCSAGFKTTQLPAASAGASFPRRHQKREIPRDDLSDDAERLVKMIGDRIMVNFGKASFLRADATGEIAEMINGQRQVSGLGFADRFAIVDRLDERQKIELLFDPVGNAEKRERALRRRGPSPGFARGMRRIKGQIDVFSRRAGDGADHPAVDRRTILKGLALNGRYPFAADKIIVMRPYRDLTGNVG